LNDHLQAFPKAEDIFVKEQPWLKNHFLPLMRIDLAEINPDWAGQKVYMLCPFEPYEGYIGIIPPSITMNIPHLTGSLSD